MFAAAAGEQQKKSELLRLRHEAKHDSKAHAMASRTKDNLKVFTASEGQSTKSEETQNEPIVDLKHLFTKHDRRVPHLPSEKIPNMLSAMKERQKQRHLARETAKKAADDAEATKVVQKELDRVDVEPDVKHRKHCALSQPSSDQKRPSGSSPFKSVSEDRSFQSMVKVKKRVQLPPMSFGQLMALAEQKQSEPVVDAQPSDVLPKKMSEVERPMTQEEKERQKRRESKEYQHWLKYGGHAPPASSGGKSRHRQHVGESHKVQRTVASSRLTGNDVLSETDSETDETSTCGLQEVLSRKSDAHAPLNRLKNNIGDVPHKRSATTENHSQKLFNNSFSSGRPSVAPSQSKSDDGKVLITKDKVMMSSKGSEAGQNGKCKSLSDELIEKLKDERRKMVERGDAVPSLSNMLQDLLNKVHGETKSLLPSETRPAKPRNVQSASAVSEHRVKPSKSVLDRSRCQSPTTSKPSRTPSQCVTVNETVVDCARDKPSSTRHSQSGNKRPMKSTWDHMNERARSKNPYHDRGILFMCIPFTSSVLAGFKIIQGCT